MAYAIETSGLTRRFGGFVAVEELDLRVRTGEVFGFLGPNGAGKSTTIKLLATLLSPSLGTARVAGHDVVEEPLAVRAAVGLVADEGADACAGWTPREYLGYFARLRGAADAPAHVEETLDLVGLDRAWRGRALGVHSTGMKRRVEIARALLGEPQVLLLDEPTRGLDLPGKRETWALLAGLARDAGVTVFLSSHDSSEVQSLCSRVAVLVDGRVRHEGPTSALGSDVREVESSLVALLTSGRDASKPSRPAGR